MMARRTGPIDAISNGLRDARGHRESGAEQVPRRENAQHHRPSHVSRAITCFVPALMTFGVGLAAIVSAPAVAQTTAASSARLETVRTRGVLRCGVGVALPGFSNANSLGEYSGLDVDFCKAVSAAVFGDASALELVPLELDARFDALLDDRIDVLARNTTWTLEREASYGDFAGVNFYDGQAFLVAVASGIRSALELDRRPICVARGTTTELNAVEFFEVNRMRYQPVYFDTNAAAAEAVEAGDCVGLTSDRAALAGYRSLFDDPDAWRILPEIISKEPLGPMVPAGDHDWSNVVSWTLHCLVAAEELGVEQNTVDDAAGEEVLSSPAARRLLGLEDELGAQLGLERRWCANAIAAVGHYGESYARHVGPGTPLNLPRGVNALWTDGGLMYAPPLR